VADISHFWLTEPPHNLPLFAEQSGEPLF